MRRGAAAPTRQETTLRTGEPDGPRRLRTGGGPSSGGGARQAAVRLGSRERGHRARAGRRPSASSSARRWADARASRPPGPKTRERAPRRTPERASQRNTERASSRRSDAAREPGAGVAGGVFCSRVCYSCIRATYSTATGVRGQVAYFPNKICGIGTLLHPISTMHPILLPSRNPPPYPANAVTRSRGDTTAMTLMSRDLAGPLPQCPRRGTPWARTCGREAARRFGRCERPGRPDRSTARSTRGAGGWSGRRPCGRPPVTRLGESDDRCANGPSTAQAADLPGRPESGPGTADPYRRSRIDAHPRSAVSRQTVWCTICRQYVGAPNGSAPETIRPARGRPATASLQTFIQGATQ